MAEIPQTAGGGAPSRYFPALTGIRAVAACMVFFHHFNPFKPAYVGAFLHDFIDEWHVGVTIFFVLSGFLISYRYREGLFHRQHSLKTYFVNRFARIYPMYFIVTVACFLAYGGLVALGGQWKVFLLNITFLRGLFDEYKFTGAAAGWSLTVEEMFYALFPLMVLASRRIKMFWQPGLFLAAGVLLWLVFKNIAFHGFFSDLTFVFEFTFFGRCFEFYTGIFLAWYICRRQEKSGVPREDGGMLRGGEGTMRGGEGTIREGEGTRRGGLRTIAGIVWIVAGISLLVINRRIFAGQPSFLLYETLVNNFFLPGGIALLFYGLIVEKTWLKAVLESTLFVQLGKSSYVFYLIHNGFVFTWLYTALHYKWTLALIALQVIAWLLYRWVEKPLNIYIRRRFGSRGSNTAALSMIGKDL